MFKVIPPCTSHWRSMLACSTSAACLERPPASLEPCASRLTCSGPPRESMISPPRNCRDRVFSAVRTNILIWGFELENRLMYRGEEMQIPSQAGLRADREIKHGEWLAVHDTEVVWGWGTPAGRIRARRRADLIIAGAALSPGKRVLEIGCGTGMFTEMFAASGATIIAVDISPELLKKARARGLDRKS